MDFPGDIPSRLAAVGTGAADVEERFIRGSGPGGQKINKTSSTVWLRHARPGSRCGARPSALRRRTASARGWSCATGSRPARSRARDAAQQLREKSRRQTRQKSYGQKVRMIQAKKHRAKNKARRGRVGDE